MKKKIYELNDGTFVISLCEVWKPGVYESKKAAWYAFEFSDNILRKLYYDSKEGVITMNSLKYAKGTI